MVKWRGEIQKEAGAMPKKTTLKGQFLRTSLAMLVLSLLIGGPIGVLSAVKQYSLWDKIPTGLALLVAAMPAFILSLIHI